MKLSEKMEAQIKEGLLDLAELEQRIDQIPEEIKESLHEVQKAIEELPEALIYPIEQIANAVEIAENEFDAMATKHRSILMMQLDESKLELRQAVQGIIAQGVDDALRDVNQRLNQLGRKVSDVSERSRFTSNRGWLGITFISLALIISISLNALLFIVNSH